jgi:hypothetical protein
MYELAERTKNTAMTASGTAAQAVSTQGLPRGRPAREAGLPLR